MKQKARKRLFNVVDTYLQDFKTKSGVCQIKKSRWTILHRPTGFYYLQAVSVRVKHKLANQKDLYVSFLFH